jgi:Flp pilus assembly protein TadG
MTCWRPKRGQDGAAAVEMAVVAPLLFTLLFGIIQTGFVVNRWITVTHAAREGVRRMALGDTATAAAATARAAAVGLNPQPTCSGTTPSPNVMQMVCAVGYDLKLFVYNNNLTIRHTARASEE